MAKRMATLCAALGIVTLASFSSAVSTTAFAASINGQSVEAGIPFVAGGVGNENRMEMEQMSPHYRLRVTNSLATGEFITDVRVRLRDANDRVVLDTIAKGPILLADPAPGAYTLESEFQGQNQTRRVTVRPTGQTDVTSNWRVS